jgi:hypothetical protein
MSERPTKIDLDHSLSLLTNEYCHKLMDKYKSIKPDRGEPSIEAALEAANYLHHSAMTQATGILLDFIERTERPPAEIVNCARAHLENLGESLIGVIAPKAKSNWMEGPSYWRESPYFYRTYFQQRLDCVLRDEVAIGFGRAEKVESKEELISAAEAVLLLKPVYRGEYATKLGICELAHAGHIRARGQRFIMDNRAANNFEIPTLFWWAEGREGLKQDWTAGDFDTWVDFGKVASDLRLGIGTVHFRAFNVSFLRAEIEQLIRRETAASSKSEAPAPPAPGGRPPADWWEDLLIDVCFEHFRGDLKPKTQADIVRAMQGWIVAHGYDAAESTIKIRAKKLWQAIQREGGN